MKGLFSLFACFLFAGCLIPHPSDGAVKCNHATGAACPDGYFCDAPSDSCWRNGHTPPVQDMSVSTDGPATRDMGDMSTTPDLASSLCSDGRKNGSETDVDCGGTCPPCPLGKGCSAGSDCASTFCSASSGLCVATQCLDGTKNGSESDVDCGGSCTGCGLGKACSTNADCSSAFCNTTTKLCVASQCMDGTKDGSETDVDCGGGICTTCTVGKSCQANTDCASASCNAASHQCTSTHCMDAVKDDAETDVDCGGGVCAACGISLGCALNRDCSSTFCNAVLKKCVASQCQDGVKNGSETDVDCGGSTCGACATGEACLANSDCTPGYCNAVSKTCVASECQDAVKDGSETDLDCGGSCATKCALNKQCSINGDCSTGSCADSVCALVSGPPNWVSAGDMPTARWGLSAATSIDGRIFAMGGNAPDASNGGVIVALPTVEALTPSSGTWATVASMPTAKGWGAAVLGADGRIYYLGGSDSLNHPQSDVEAYTPAANSWTMVPSMPTARVYLAAALGSDGRIYAMGGAADGFQSTILNTVESFSTVSGSWTTVAPLPTKRSHPTAALGIDNRTYVFGGQTGGYPTIISVSVNEGYSPALNSWAQFHNVPSTVMADSAAAGPDGRIYLVSGTGSAAFNPSTNSWAPVATRAKPVSEFALAVANDGRIYAIGGANASSPAATVEYYGPAVSLSATSGVHGSTTTITGSNFAASANVSVYFGGSTLPNATGTTDATGNLGAPIILPIPSVAQGTYTVTIIDDRSQYPIKLSYFVTG